MSDAPLSASELSELTKGLNRLARNLWWTWNHEAQEVFNELSGIGRHLPDFQLYPFVQ